jgi:hypothetical protein
MDEEKSNTGLYPCDIDYRAINRPFFSQLKRHKLQFLRNATACHSDISFFGPLWLGGDGYTIFASLSLDGGCVGGRAFRVVLSFFLPPSTLLVLFALPLPLSPS